MVFRNCLGMIMSVSILTSGMGAATAVSLLNFSISVPLVHVTHIGQATDHSRCGRHCRAHQMGAPTASLPPLEVAVRRGGAAIAFFQLVRIHGKAHRAAGLAPFKTGILKDLVQPLFFRLKLDEARTRNDEGADALLHLAA